MPKVALFLIKGFEETEAITSLDILRRGGVEVDLVSLENTTTVTSKHQVRVVADKTFDEVRLPDYDYLLIPGGTTDYLNRTPFLDAIMAHAATDKGIAAICAAPAVLGKLGLLRGKRAVCYPGMEHMLDGANIGDAIVETDGLFTTSKGPGTTIPFALRVLEILQGAECAQTVANDFLAHAR